VLLYSWAVGRSVGHSEQQDDGWPSDSSAPLLNFDLLRQHLRRRLLPADFIFAPNHAKTQTEW